PCTRRLESYRSFPEIGLQRVALNGFFAEPLAKRSSFGLQLTGGLTIPREFGAFGFQFPLEFERFFVRRRQPLVDASDLFGLQLQPSASPLGIDVQLRRARACRSQFRLHSITGILLR